MSLMDKRIDAFEWVGCLLPWEEGEEVGRGFCVVRSRIFQEVWVSDFAGDLKGKARSRAPFCDGELCWLVGLGCCGDRYMPKLGQECVLIVVADT
jgi:hypothetical protein